MTNDEYEDIVDMFAMPHISFPQSTIQQKKVLAWHVATLKGGELLVLSSIAFSYSSIIAGITLGQVEYFAKNAPAIFKKELLNSIRTDYRMKEVFEIAKMMDEDLGEGVTQNKKRVKNVQQYIQDNFAVFQF